ncbi:MAG TPA: ABC transporter ATP-binding protein [Phycisphaerales bacterium]|nr:ABC transporter ATP-binding protein [Phycisphaerales bacterium]
MTTPHPATPTPAGAPLLEVRHLVTRFPVRGGILNRVVGHVHAVSGVSFSVPRGEVLGVVGESGCGKSTLGKTILRLVEPTSGQVLFDGQDLTTLGHGAMMPVRRRMQMIFQDPYSSLNPRLTIRRMLREVVRFHDIVPTEQSDDYIIDLITRVGLRKDAADKFPHEFSGGQRQRIGIARALAVKPELLIADEPVSALDVSIQAQVLNLLMDLQKDLHLTVLFISHDLKVVEHFCDRVLVMYLGKVVEELPCDNLLDRARHPYTRALLAANPIDDPDERRPISVLKGDVPSPLRPPPGCPFIGRCPVAVDRCRNEMPPLVAAPTVNTLTARPATQSVACWVETPDARPNA